MKVAIECSDSQTSFGLGQRFDVSEATTMLECSLFWALYFNDPKP